MSSEEGGGERSLDPPLRGDPDGLQRFVRNLGMHFEEYRIPPIGGEILGVLTAASRPVSQEELQDLLEVSRSSVSTNLRSLLMAGLVEKVPNLDERAEGYALSEGAWTALLELRLESLRAFLEAAQTGLSALDARSPARTRMEDFLAWVRIQVDAMRAALERWTESREGPEGQEAQAPRPRSRPEKPS